MERNTNPTSNDNKVTTDLTIRSGNCYLRLSEMGNSKKALERGFTIDETCSVQLIFINGTNGGHTFPRATERCTIKCIFLSNFLKKKNYFDTIP